MGRHSKPRFLGWKTALGTAAVSAVVITTAISVPAGAASNASGYDCGRFRADGVSVPAEGDEYLNVNTGVTWYPQGGYVDLTPGTYDIRTNGTSVGGITITVNDVKTCGGKGDPTTSVDPTTPDPTTVDPTTPDPTTVEPTTPDPTPEPTDTEGPEPTTVGPTPDPDQDLCDNVEGKQKNESEIPFGLHQLHGTNTCVPNEPDPAPNPNPNPSPAPAPNPGGSSNGSSNNGGDNGGSGSGSNSAYVANADAGNQQPAAADCPPDQVVPVASLSQQQEEFYFSGVGGAG